MQKILRNNIKLTTFFYFLLIPFVRYKAAGLEILPWILTYSARFAACIEFVCIQSFTALEADQLFSCIVS